MGMRVLSRGLLGGPFVLLAAAALGSAGCSGSATATVTGKVSSNGVPLKGGNVTFFSTEGKRSVTGPINEDGTYRLEKVPAGKVKIVVETESLNPATKPRVKYSPPKDQAPPGGGYAPPNFEELAKRYRKIPDAYATQESTPLEYTVTSGSQEKDIQAP